MSAGDADLNADVAGPRTRLPRSSLRPPPSPGHAPSMGLPAVKPIRATYADLEAVPADKVAELIRGTLYVSPARRRSTPARRLA